MKRIPILFFLWSVCILGMGTSQSYAQTGVSALPDSKPVVLSDGKKVWPPQGPGCEALVQCCQAAEKRESTASLMCQMTVALPIVGEGAQRAGEGK